MPNLKSQEELIAELKEAGSKALLFNAPLSRGRAHDSFAFMGASNPKVAVDFGCGLGSYIRLLIAALPSTRGVGLDLDAVAIAQAQHERIAVDLVDRLSFEVADASQYRGPVDASICIGSSHVFGGADRMFQRLGEIQPSGVAVIGDGVWMQTPDDWCTSTFGEMPLCAAGLGEIAERNGWEVIQASLSSLGEWDNFEHTWNCGVRAVGTDLAAAFADERATEYQRYRGILGFGWLYLRRR